MTTSTPSGGRTEGQEKKFLRLVEDGWERAVRLALKEVDADSAGWQRVLEHGDELHDAIAEAVVAKTKELSVFIQYANEEVESNYGYLSGYKPKPIAEQVKCLCELPELKNATYDETIAARPLPEGAERWFAIPRWQKIAPTYGEAVEKVLALIAKTRNGKFTNYRKGQLGLEHLRQHERTAMFQKLGNEQKDHDILVVPAQFGLRHRGKSVRRAREVFAVNEFGLDVFSVGIMLLTHPERLAHYDDLWIDCAGDEYSPFADGDFSLAQYFYFRDGLVGFDTYFVGHAHVHCGSASGFCP